MRYDWLRFKARKTNQKLDLSFDKLHLACGFMKVEGWLNVDVTGSDYNADLATTHLPFPNKHYSCVIMQHAIGCFDVDTELPMLLRELHRITKIEGELWLTTPDMRKVCQAYLDDRGESLIKGRKTRFNDWKYPANLPPQHFINVMFHNYGELKNIFDFELLSTLLQEAGFAVVTEENESSFQQSFSEFPNRNDQEQTLYVKAIRK